jgi:hypothetical protein
VYTVPLFLYSAPEALVVVPVQKIYVLRFLLHEESRVSLKPKFEDDSTPARRVNGDVDRCELMVEGPVVILDLLEA